MPASFVSAANSNALAEANSDGLTTSAQPAASAAAHFLATNRSGEFQASQRRHNADRLMGCVGKGLRLVDRHKRALELVDEPAEIPLPFRMVAQLGQHLRHELAIVAYLDLGKALCICGDEVAELAHRLASR